MSKDTISLRFEGDRFSKHYIPLDALSDLPAINSMIVKVASHLLLKKNPERQRVPKGFRDNVYLSLKGVGSGSAVAELAITHNGEQQTLFESEEEECMKEAFEIVTDFIGGGANVPQDMADIIAPNFNSIGQNLRHGDSLSFECGSEKRSVLNEDTRLRLVKKKSDYSSNVEMYGTVSELDRDNGTFKVTYKGDSKNQRVEVPVVGEEMARDVLAALGKYGDQKVYIRGRGQYRDQKLQKTDEVESSSCWTPETSFPG